MRTRALVSAAFAFASPVVACATSGSNPGVASSHLAIDPRYEAVHNALAGAGMAEVGAIMRGAVAKGGEVRLPIEVRPPCTTFVVLGAAGSGNLDATVVDAAGRVLGRDQTTDAEPVVKACAAERGPYTLIVKSNGASGDFLVGQYTSDGALAASAAPKVDGTCDGPYPLTDGKVSGNTSHAHQELEGTCASTGGRELVYRMELKERRHTIIDVDPKFDAVLYIRKDSCADDAAEVACNDDVGTDRHSHVDATLDPGVYFVVVDGLGTDSGAFQMTVETKPAEPLARACGRAPSLVFGSPVHESWEGAVTHMDDSCVGPERGPDFLYKLTVPPPNAARVRLSETSEGASPVLELRDGCSEDAQGLACSTVGESDTVAASVMRLEPGTYVVVAGSGASKAKGTFDLTAEIGRESGEGTEGDTCRDAIPIRATDRVEGDTFHARDDSASHCGGRDAPDVVYRIEAAHRTRLVASLYAEEGQHVLSLSRACSDRSAAPSVGNPANIQKNEGGEICGHALATTLAPGSWFLTVDGKTSADFGDFWLDVDLHDARPREAACKNVPTITNGARVTGDTSSGGAGGLGNAFTNGCERSTLSRAKRAASTMAAANAARGEAESEPSAPEGSPDRVFRFTIKERSSVSAVLTTAGWSGEIALRRACEDGGEDVEVGCNPTTSSPSVELETQLDAGSYFLVVDGQGDGNHGKFTLTLTTHPESEPNTSTTDDE